MFYIFQNLLENEAIRQTLTHIARSEIQAQGGSTSLFYAFHSFFSVVR